MSDLAACLWIEGRKAARSRVPLLTALLFLLMPLAGAFIMIILKDPEMARRLGLISAKAQLLGGSADWPTYLGVIAQGAAIGGFFLFSLIESWVFGREFADGTVKDLLAVPVARSAILTAKFVVVALWSLALAAMIYVIGAALGALIGLPGGGAIVLLRGGASLAVTAVMVIAVATPVALFASAGRGYLVPMGAVFVLVVLAQLIAAIGWGAYFPWSVPALYAGLTGSPAADLVPASYWLVALTGLAGMIGTGLWWQWADQSH